MEAFHFEREAVSVPGESVFLESPVVMEMTYFSAA